MAGKRRSRASSARTAEPVAANKPASAIVRKFMSVRPGVGKPRGGASQVTMTGQSDNWTVRVAKAGLELPVAVSLPILAVSPRVAARMPPPAPGGSNASDHLMLDAAVFDLR